MNSACHSFLLFLLYPSNDKTIKELRDRLLRTRGHPQLDQITDINVICGVIKDFLRNLREPLLTFALHETFINAACKLLLKCWCKLSSSAFYHRIILVWAYFSLALGVGGFSIENICDTVL